MTTEFWSQNRLREKSGFADNYRFFFQRHEKPYILSCLRRLVFVARERNLRALKALRALRALRAPRAVRVLRALRAPKKRNKKNKKKKQRKKRKQIKKKTGRSHSDPSLRRRAVVTATPVCDDGPWSQRLLSVTTGRGYRVST